MAPGHVQKTSDEHERSRGNKKSKSHTRSHRSPYDNRRRSMSPEPATKTGAGKKERNQSPRDEARSDLIGTKASRKTNKGKENSDERDSAGQHKSADKNNNKRTMKNAGSESEDSKKSTRKMSKDSSGSNASRVRTESRSSATESRSSVRSSENRSASRASSYTEMTSETQSADDSDEKKKQKRREQREARRLSKTVEQKLTHYINNEKREMRFNTTGIHTTTKRMLYYDVEYQLKEQRKDRKEAKKKDKQDKQNDKKDKTKRINPTRENTSRQVVLQSEADRLSSVANEIFDSTPVSELTTIHRYRLHSPRVASSAENGHVQNYRRHVGAALHSKCYVDYYMKEGLQTGSSEGNERLQKLPKKKEDDQNSNDAEDEDEKKQAEKKTKKKTENSRSRNRKDQERRYQASAWSKHKLTDDESSRPTSSRSSRSSRSMRSSMSSRSSRTNESSRSRSSSGSSHSSRSRERAEEDVRSYTDSFVSVKRDDSDTDSISDRDSDVTTPRGQKTYSERTRSPSATSVLSAETEAKGDDAMDRKSNYSYSNDFEPDTESRTSLQQEEPVKSPNASMTSTHEPGSPNRTSPSDPRSPSIASCKKDEDAASVHTYVSVEHASETTRPRKNTSM